MAIVSTYEDPEIDADDIAFTPAQGLLSTKVQSAIEEAVKKLTVPCKEENTSALKKGQVLCATGASGEKLLAGLCTCTDLNKLRIGGLASTDIGQNASGFAVYKGELLGVDTRATNLAVNPNGETWAEGALLWATATGGGMSHNRPTSGRQIKAAISRKGSCADDILVAISHENAIWMTAASGEDIVLRMGDSAGSNKVSGRDYANNEVFSFESDGKLIITGTKENVTSHSATEAVTAATMYGNLHKITGAYTLTLPSAVIGMSAVFRASTATAFSVKAGASDHFEMFDGTVLDAADKQTSGGTKNEFIQIYCEVANTWITCGISGAFSDTGA